MQVEPLNDLERAHAAFDLGELAHGQRSDASRRAFGHYQQALQLLRGGAPVVREDDERASLEFLLGLPQEAVDPEALDEGVRRLRAEAVALLAEREALLERKRSRGWRRPIDLVGPALIVILLCVVGTTVAQRLREPADVAEGKPWVASSSWGTCTPRAGRCGPLVSRIFFHTKDDDSPWVRFDLLTPTTISAATIINRSDDAPERAVPLLIEVSDDDQTWREVARRESNFTIWRSSFEPVTTRFVRVRVPRKSWLHLEAVKLHH